jgi:outer membrane lipoprotein-sorting protein
MKKLLVALLILLSTVCFAQQISLQQIFEEFQVGATVQKLDEFLIIQDTIKISSTDIIFRVSYLMKTTEFYFKKNNIDYRTIINECKAVIYRTEEFMLMMPSEWVVQYYMSDTMKRSELLNALFKEQYDSFKASQYKNLGSKQYK